MAVDGVYWTHAPAVNLSAVKFENYEIHRSANTQSAAREKCGMRSIRVYNVKRSSLRETIWSFKTRSGPTRIENYV